MLRCISLLLLLLSAFRMLNVCAVSSTSSLLKNQNRTFVWNGVSSGHYDALLMQVGFCLFIYLFIALWCIFILFRCNASSTKLHTGVQMTCLFFTLVSGERKGRGCECVQRFTTDTFVFPAPTSDICEQIYLPICFAATGK